MFSLVWPPELRWCCVISVVTKRMIILWPRQLFHSIFMWWFWAGIMHLCLSLCVIPQGLPKDPVWRLGKEEDGDGAEGRRGPSHPAGPEHDPLLRHDVLCPGNNHDAFLRRQVCQSPPLLCIKTQMCEISWLLYITACQRASVPVSSVPHSCRAKTLLIQIA